MNTVQHTTATSEHSSMAEAQEPRRSTRTTYASEKELDSQSLALIVQLDDLITPEPGEETFSTEALLQIKNELTSTFLNYRKVAKELDRAKHIANAVQERVELREEFGVWYKKFNDRIHAINDLRKAAGEEVSTVASLSFPSFVSLQMSAKEKCERYVQELPTSPSQVIEEEEEQHVEYQSYHQPSREPSETQVEPDGAVNNMINAVEALTVEEIPRNQQHTSESIASHSSNLNPQSPIFVPDSTFHSAFNNSNIFSQSTSANHPSSAPMLNPVASTPRGHPSIAQSSNAIRFQPRTTLGSLNLNISRIQRPAFPRTPPPLQPMPPQPSVTAPAQPRHPMLPQWTSAQVPTVTSVQGGGTGSGPSRSSVPTVTTKPSSSQSGGYVAPPQITTTTRSSKGCVPSATVSSRVPRTSQSIGCIPKQTTNSSMPSASAAQGRFNVPNPQSAPGSQAANLPPFSSIYASNQNSSIYYDAYNSTRNINSSTQNNSFQPSINNNNNPFVNFLPSNGSGNCNNNCSINDFNNCDVNNVGSTRRGGQNRQSVPIDNYMDEPGDMIVDRGQDVMDHPDNQEDQDLPFQLSFDFNPLLPAYLNDQRVMGDITPAKVMLKHELLARKDVSDLFSGDATKFYGFIHKFVSMVRNVGFNAYEILQILLANVSGEARTLVKRHEYSSYRNGVAALNAVWRELFNAFGRSIHIKGKIKERLAKVGQIPSKDSIGKLQDLQEICQIIDVSLRDEQGHVALYSDESGQREIYSCFPNDMYGQWRRIVRRHKGAPSFDVLFEFIKDAVEDVTTLEIRSKGKSSDKAFLTKAGASDPPNNAKCKDNASPVSAPLGAAISGSTSRPSYNIQERYCFWHKTHGHDLFDCKNFKDGQLTTDDRERYIRDNKLCFRCFRPHSRRLGCNFLPKCTKPGCQGRHQTLLHNTKYIQDRLNSLGQASNASSSNPAQQGTSNVVCCSSTQPGGGSYSKVLLVDVWSPGSKKSLRVYAILDEQSSRSFMTPTLAEALGAEGPDIEFSLSTLNGLKSEKKGKLIRGLKIKGVSEQKTFDLPPITTVDCIPDCKSEVASPQVVHKLKHVRNLAKFFLPIDESAEVHILIGRDGKDLLKSKCIGRHAPFVHHTSLGFSLVGITNEGSIATNNCFTVLKTMEHFDMTLSIPAIQCNSLVRLPDDELDGVSKSNLKFDAILSKGTHINEAGNITMPLPFEDEHVIMPNNSKAVYARTKGTLERLKKNPDKLTECCKVMGSYLDANHIEEVPPDEYEGVEGKTWFIPVFPVTNEKKSKTRIVFDSSASYHRVSLNSVLLQGPDRNNDLRAVLMRFRNGIIGVSGDVEHMFHNFHLPKPHTNYVRFYWFKQNLPSNPIVQWRALVHVFGNRPSPSCAIYGLRAAMNYEVADDCPQESKDLINSNCYVDDALGAFDSEFDAIQALQGAKDKLAMFNIRLHKLASNNKSVIGSFPESELSKAYAEEGEVLCGALGLVWSLESDTFKFTLQIPDKDFTPRGVLSVNHSVWDPLGLLSPLLLKGRLLQREMFEDRQGKPKGVAVQWDAPLEMKYFQKWCDFKDSLTILDTISFPRAYYSPAVVPVIMRELHCFSDASYDGLGFCIYLRSFGNGMVESSLVFAGSKVVPKAASSMPRLELCSCVEVSQAALRVAEALNISPERVHFYSDSEICLGYLRNTERKFTRYISRRIELISNMTSKATWRYINTRENPADIASRCQQVDILSSELWLYGPPFLRDFSYNANVCTNDSVPVDLPEQVNDDVCLVTKPETEPTLFSLSAATCGSYERLLNIVRNVLGILRATDLCRQRLGVSLAPRCSGDFLSKQELVQYIMRDCQSTIDLAKVQHLSPFKDKQGVLRAGGRLRNAFIPFDGKHPMLVPEKSPLALLLVRHFHEAVVHQGRMLTHSALRSNGFYIPGARRLIESYISTCGTCRRLRGEPVTPKMADLPLERLHETPAFCYVSLDLWGPYHVTEGQTTRKNSSTKKMWGVVFVCQTTRAVHVESVMSLDTTAMVNALRRFFCVRGTARYLHSDCGSNLVACCKEIGATKIYGCIKSEADKHNCIWSFNPPGASHMMGSAERAIGSFRKIVGASLLLLGNRAITRDEMHTLFCEAASIINNTPLYSTPPNPNEPMAISPASLLTLKDTPQPPPLTSFSESDLNSYGLQRWRRVQLLSEQFWIRWRKHYLDTLQSRSKWTKRQPNVKVGDVVILKNKQAPRNDWEIGIINAVNTSDVDGAVRSCEVRTTTGTFRRAVHTLVLLSSGGEGVSPP